MSRNTGMTISIAVFIILGSLCFFSGCSDDDPVAPENLPDDGYLAVSPDSLMSLWRNALTTLDSTMYAGMYHPDFLYQFSVVDQAEFPLITDYMTGSETVQTGWNMFSGQDVWNWQGDRVPAVARIQFPQWDQETPWSFTRVGLDPPVARARFTMQMYVERGFGIPTLSAAGTYEFSAAERDSLLPGGTVQQYYQLLGMSPVTLKVAPDVTHTWGGVNLTYLTNEDPQAGLSVSDVGGSPLPLYRCDASQSNDADSGLHEFPYRWRFEVGGEWTMWTADPVITHSYPAPGDYTITLEVRDRWGAVGEDAMTVSPALGLPFPGSPDQLMANFRTIYETRGYEEYVQSLHPDFLTILQQSTTEEFPDVGETLDFNEEVWIHQRMFSGLPVIDPDGNLVPGVQTVSFSVFQPQDAWTLSPPDDPIPGAMWAPYDVVFLFDRGQNFSTLRIEGIIKFYVTSSDSLHGGVPMQYYQMIGQEDLTDSFKATDAHSWGSFKALYR
jgi:hypothetical protein